jgi:hypothetical protein
VRNFLGTTAVLIAIATAAPAHAGFWSDLGSKVSSMFSGAGISSGYTNVYAGTTTQPIVVSRFPPSRSAAARADLLRRQQVQSGQFNIGTWLLTGVKVPPARVVLQNNTAPISSVYHIGTTCHGTGCQ